MNAEKDKDKGKGGPPGKGKSSKFDLKNRNVQYALIGVFALGALVYGWVNQVYTPMAESIAALTEKKEQLEAELAKINTLKPQLERLREESVILNARLDSLRNMFPDEKEIPKLIRQITTVNRKSNITTTRFTPKPDVVQEYYVENKYDVALIGDYHNIGAFFSHLANFQLIINLSGVTITANSGYSKGDPDANIERVPSALATFEMTTFSSRR